MAAVTDSDTRRNRRRVERADALLGCQVGAYGSGSGHLRATPTFVAVAVAVTLGCAGIAVTTGRIVFPGFLFLVLGISSVRPRRGVVVAGTTVVVLHESMVNALPTSTVAIGSVADLRPVTPIDDSTRNVRIRVGTETVRMGRLTYDMLQTVARRSSAAAVAHPGGAAATVAPAGWHPDPTARFDHRYWDGRSWTGHVARGGAVGHDPLATVPC
jgi:hypothetical protein